jgi:GTP cyclohydrolase II
MKKFVETRLQTKYGDFMFRTYAADQGKETVVIYTETLNPNDTPLVRIHSECMTGDLFGSLRCDCGDQLEASLNLISKSGNGVLVYLRQEGRGIGLFEKVRSYQLQHQGYDTFEANVLLGHGPDQRTYEHAQTALQDLNITTINLLTNNPSKVSEVAKLGIKVANRIPLVMKTNIHNEKYFEAKRDKFKHFFHKDISYYFYQFHVDSVSQVEELGEFLKDKKQDPLLKICVGVGVNNFIFEDSNRIKEIQQIFNASALYEGFVPILHFSFSQSVDTQADIKKIKELLPFVEYLQTNDLPSNDLEAIKLACDLFLADIPLFDENFELIENEEFRNTIKDNKAFLLLDNSKGKGIKESKESLMKKIERLLAYGLNDIAIFGGFGPDDLDTYFELRRYYKINFSIDAESKLKSNDGFDMEKTKTYITQLLRFDDPKTVSIEQTRTFLQQAKIDDWTSFKVRDYSFKVHPAVFNPSMFPSTSWFADEVIKITEGQKDFCEIGCGAGVISCLAALHNNELNVVSSDINPFATETSKLNVEDNNLESQVNVYNGDVFDGIPKDIKFDSIFWALPFGFLDPGVEIDYTEMQVFDPGYRATRKFLEKGKGFLKDGGVLYLGFSDDLGHYELLEEIAKKNGIKLEKIAQEDLQEEDVVSMEIYRGTYL